MRVSSKVQASAAAISRRAFLSASVAAGILFSGSLAIAQDKPARGGSIVISQTADAQPRNILVGRAGNHPWIKNVFETLTRNNPETFQPDAVLAKSWTLADDKKSMEIQLRDDVLFHTGRQMTAADVKYTLEVAADPKTAAQTGFIAREIASVEVTGDYALQLTFKSALPNIFDLFEEAHVIDKETYDKREDGSQVIGTGPFKFSTWTPGASIVLVRNEAYRNPELPYLDQIEYAVIPDSTAAISALRSRRTSLAYGLDQRDLIEFANNPQFVIKTGGGNMFPLGVDVAKAPFDKKEVRQAIGFAVDRKRINGQIFDGSGTPTPLFWGVGSPGYDENLVSAYAYDPDKARALIEAAGAKGAAIKLTVPSIPSSKSTVEIIQNNLRDVGLVPEVTVLDVPEFDKRQIAGNLGDAFLLIHGQVGFSTPTLIGSLPSLRKGNPSGFWTDEYVALQSKVKDAKSPEESAAAIQALSAYMIDEAFALMIVQAPSQQIMATNLRGVQISVRAQLLLAEAHVAE